MAVILLVIAAYFLSCATAYPTGAGPDACKNFMMPYHLDDNKNVTLDQVEVPSPYEISVAVEKDYSLVKGGEIVQGNNVLFTYPCLVIVCI